MHLSVKEMLLVCAFHQGTLSKRLWFMTPSLKKEKSELGKVNKWTSTSHISDIS